MEHFSLLKQTVAYKLIENDKNSNSLCHAYLILSADRKYLRDSLKEFAKIIMSQNPVNLFGVSDDEKRIYDLIDGEIHPDVKIYPDKGKITVADVDEIIEDSVIRPLEGDKKIFILCIDEEMTVGAQNKLLKTLEEPPQNVHILIGSTSEENILPTVKSRVKKTFLPVYTESQLIDELSKTKFDRVKLQYAASSSDGTLGDTERLYDDTELEKTYMLATEVILEMQKSSDVLKYSVKLMALKDRLNEFMDVLELLFKDMLLGLTAGEKYVKNTHAYQKTKNANYNEGAILGALAKIREAKKRKRQNANDVMVVDFMLLGILEEKIKWQRL